MHKWMQQLYSLIGMTFVTNRFRLHSFLMRHADAVDIEYEGTVFVVFTQPCIITGDPCPCKRKDYMKRIGLSG